MSKKTTLEPTKLRRYSLLETEQAAALALLKMTTEALVSGTTVSTITDAGTSAEIPVGALTAMVDLLGVLATRPEALVAIIDDAEMTTSREATWLLNLPKGRIYELLKSKVIPGSRLRIRMSDIIAYGEGRIEELPFRGYVTTPWNDDPSRAA